MSPSRPRILILTTSYLPLVGGSELAIKNIAGRLPDFDFDLVTKRYSKEVPAVEKLGRVRVFRVRSPKFLLPIAISLKAIRLSRSHPYSLIHAYQASHAAGAGWLLKALFRVRTPFLVTLQEGKDLDRQSMSIRWFRWLIFTQADAVTAISGYLCMYAKGLTRAPCTLIPNGVDLNLFRPVTSHTPGHLIFSASRLVPKNGLENLIQAMPQVVATIPDARLVIAGDGPLRSELEVLSRELGVRNVVDFRGLITHDSLPSVYADVDVFVRPSLSEGLGTAFLEAMACGVPVVGSTAGGIADFLRHEQTGLVCDPEDSADIAKQVVRMFTDAALRDRMAANALAMVREKYGWDIIAQKMDAVYGGMIHSRQ